MGPLTSLFCPEGGFLYTVIVPGEKVFPFVSRRYVPGGVVLDEIDSCIIMADDQHPILPSIRHLSEYLMLCNFLKYFVEPQTLFLGDLATVQRNKGTKENAI